MQPLYLFQQRPLTPPKVSRQEAYRRELERQVEVKEDTRKRLAEEALLDRMEQAQRAEELAAERERHLRQKVGKMNTYKNGPGARCLDVVIVDLLNYTVRVATSTRTLLKLSTGRNLRK